MAIEVLKVELKSVSDASGLEKGITSGVFTADEVIGVIGKTEGNGGVNDFTRILADQAFRRVLLKHGKRDEKAVNQIPMVWSGGCDGVITPHATVFARNDKTGPASKSRLVMGTAMSAVLLPEDIGRPAMVEKVAAAVKDAMRDAGISDPKDVHYVQTKTPLLTIDSVRDAELRGKHVACEVHDSMGVSNGTTALGIAVALGEIKMPKAEEICRNLDLYSSVASCSSGVELTQAQIVLLGNKAGAGGRYRIGHSVMKDALDIDGIYESIRDAGLSLPERARASDLNGKLVNCFMKCEADRRGTYADAARSCWMTSTSIIIAIRKAPSAASRRRRSAIRPSSFRSTPCTRDRKAVALSSQSSTLANRVSRMTKDLWRKPAHELAALVRKRELSPVEVLDAHLAVIERLNPTLNAIVTLVADSARADARAAEQAVMRGDKLALCMACRSASRTSLRPRVSGRLMAPRFMPIMSLPRTPRSSGD